VNGVQDAPSLRKVKHAPGGVAVIYAALTVIFFRANDARHNPEWQHQSESNYS